MSGTKTSNVIALTIVAAAKASQDTTPTDVLIGVRRPDVHVNHKGIASVPTKRIPLSTFREVLFALNRGSESFCPAFSGRSSENVVCEVVESILARKLGLADDLEYGRIQYRAIPKVFKQGRSPVLVDSDQAETLRMINICVCLTHGRELIPDFTASYSALKWFPIKEAVNQIATGAPFEFGSPDKNSQYLCGGLCICTASVLLEELESHMASRYQSASVTLADVNFGQTT